MADEALNMLHNGSGSRMDVFKCISILLGTDGYGLANSFSLHGVHWLGQPTVDYFPEPGNRS